VDSLKALDLDRPIGKARIQRGLTSINECEDAQPWVVCKLRFYLAERRESREYPSQFGSHPGNSR
jgi:hypothetical protein